MACFEQPFHRSYVKVEICEECHGALEVHYSLCPDCMTGFWGSGTCRHCNCIMHDLCSCESEPYDYYSDSDSNDEN